MNNINFFNETEKEIVDLDTLKELINYAVKKEKKEKIEFSIIFIDNKKMKTLNKRYRNINKTTDVLTFVLSENEDIIDRGLELLGDIYISIDKAEEQSIEYGHSFLREVSFLMIHGFLHLLGYDHMNIKDERKMFDRQEEILNEYGIKR